MYTQKAKNGNGIRKNNKDYLEQKLAGYDLHVVEQHLVYHGYNNQTYFLKLIVKC